MPKEKKSKDIEQLRGVLKESDDISMECWYDGQSDEYIVRLYKKMFGDSSIETLLIKKLEIVEAKLNETLKVLKRT